MDKLFSDKLYNLIINTVDIEKILEFRVRLNKPLVLKTLKEDLVVKNLSNGLPYLVKEQDISNILNVASKHSMYSIEDKLQKGYITYNNGIRIGVVGKAVYLDNKIKTISDINSLIIRVQHEIFGIADELLKTIYKNNILNNVLIISKPSAGKTTLLREITRNISNNMIDTLIIDERNEIAGVIDGKPTFDVGNCSDILTNMVKTDAYENIIRTCNPKLIVIDEIFSLKEFEELYKIAYCGVRVLASRHIDNKINLNNDICRDIIYKIFDYIVVLSSNNIGEIEELIKVKNV